MNTRRLIFCASAAFVASTAVACSSDTASTPAADTGADTGTTDTGAGTDTAIVDDAGADDAGGGDTGGGGVPLAVTFTLTNGNPGGLSRWVQLRTNIDTPGWWDINENSSIPNDLGAHDSCAVDNCGEDPVECPDGGAEILELGAGESVTDTWDLFLHERLQENGATCEMPYEATETQFRVSLCWSPVAPVDGRLPEGTISCTRLAFQIGLDSQVSYAIEGLSTCGDGDCDAGETSLVCPQDCSGVTPGVVQLSCNQYCNKSFECDDSVRRDECQVGCSDEAAGLAGATEDCIQAVADFYACVGQLDCADLAALIAGTGSACSVENGAAATACN